jgi:hypothetical protein
MKLDTEEDVYEDNGRMTILYPVLYPCRTEWVGVVHTYFPVSQFEYCLGY